MRWVITSDNGHMVLLHSSHPWSVRVDGMRQAKQLSDGQDIPESVDAQSCLDAIMQSKHRWQDVAGEAHLFLCSAAHIQCSINQP